MEESNKLFRAFMQAREAASNAYLAGNPQPLAHITAHDANVTFFAPNGKCVKGTNAVIGAFDKGATLFKSADKNEFETFYVEVGDTLAYWVGLQHALVQQQGSNKRVEYNLRLTEIFRREEEGWKLVHRHADPAS